MKKLLIINGPNLNMLGIREPAIYGAQNYETLLSMIRTWAKELGAEVDALKAVGIPAAEVHISDVNTREEFRKLSYAGMACEAHFIGLGFDGYKKAMEYLVSRK